MRSNIFWVKEKAELITLETPSGPKPAGVSCSILEGIKMVRETEGHVEGGSGQPCKPNKGGLEANTGGANTCFPEERTCGPMDFKKSADHSDVELNAPLFLSLVPLYV